HVLFCSAAEAGRLARLGYAPRLGFQFQWRDEGFGDFDGFVGRFNHKRRKELLRERRQVREAGIGVQVLRPGGTCAPSIAGLSPGGSRAGGWSPGSCWRVRPPGSAWSS
ncbi:MAG: N-acetyltransferase, partial [Deltaproteobacteria bacterium]|nr:N-acetyltransferase [Deltaproteobacteria bacterium]